MNRTETLLMNNPARAWLQRSDEVPLLSRLGAELGGAPARVTDLHSDPAAVTRRPAPGTFDHRRVQVHGRDVRGTHALQDQLGPDPRPHPISTT